MQRVALMLTLDGTRPSGALEWVSRVAPLLRRLWSGPGTGAPGAGSGPWQRGRALLGSGWWRGAWAPKRGPGRGGSIRRQQRDRLLKLNPKAAAAETQALTARQQSWFGLAATGIGMVTGVRSGLRRPQRLTVLAIAGEAPAVVFSVLRVARAVQRRRPRIAAGQPWSQPER